MALAIHCDRVGCNTWTKDLSAFIIVYFDISDARHYCTRWCMVVEESRDVEPTEVVE